MPWLEHGTLRIILDMDSSESPVYGEQEGATYNGHFLAVCYHPLFLFNEFGDCERAMLPSGNVHSAERWQEVLEAIVERYKKRGIRLLFRSDAAFAKPEVYENTWSNETLAMLSVFPPTRYCMSISSIY